MESEGKEGDKKRFDACQAIAVEKEILDKKSAGRGDSR